MRKELTGPNQRWCWDISYLPTYERGVFLYLYLAMDEWSRKVIQWLVSWTLEADEARRLLDGAMVSENILDLPEDQRPEVVNDRGRQMKAKSVRRLFEEHGMPQLFARPRTPNDNPFIEAMFSTTKTAPEYPGRFRDKEDAEGYFGEFFPWYCNEHYHSGIDYVTPAQAHAGLRPAIVAERRAKMAEQRERRKEVNRRRQLAEKTALPAASAQAGQVPRRTNEKMRGCWDKGQREIVAYRAIWEPSSEQASLENPENAISAIAAAERRSVLLGEENMRNEIDKSMGES